MFASQRWHTEHHFRLLASHRALPSPCPLPSAVNTGGRSNLCALRGELWEEGLCLTFGRSGTWVENQARTSKASKLAFGHPRCTASTPSVFDCQRDARGAGEGGVQRVSSVLCSPTGNDTLPVPSQRQTERGIEELPRTTGRTLGPRSNLAAAGVQGEPMKTDGGVRHVTSHLALQSVSTCASSDRV